MKPKIILLMFTGLLAGSVAALGQDNPPTATAVSTNSAPAADATTTSTSAATTELSTNVTAEATNTVAVAPDAAAVSTNAPVIPLIVMDEVPLSDAIKNLARQANINYMLDPKLSYGQPGPDGKIVPQPSVSIRWENVTAEQALNAMLNNYNLTLVDDPKTHIARVTVKDPAAAPPLLTRIIQLKYAGASNVVGSVQTILTDKRSKVVADVRTSQLVVLATEPEQDAVNVLVARLDTMTKQVLIEAKLVETSINPSTIKGLDWRGTLQAQHLAFGNNLQTKPSESGESANNPLATQWPKLMFDTAKGFNPNTAFLDADGVNAVFSFMNEYSEAKVISSPRTVTLDNEQAILSVTRATPIINVTAGTQVAAGGSQINYTNLGVILLVTPRVSADNYINLHVQPQVSRIFDTVTKVIQGAAFQADEYDIRTMETHVMIPSGNTLVLGGLVQDDNRSSSTKVPVLGDIPGLGYAFRSNSKTRQKGNLLVFITPTIVQDSDYHPTTTDFLKTQMPGDLTSSTDWSAWDSTQPKWGKKSKDSQFDETLSH